MFNASGMGSATLELLRKRAVKYGKNINCGR